MIEKAKKVLELLRQEEDGPVQVGRFLEFFLLRDEVLRTPQPAPRSMDRYLHDPNKYAKETREMLYVLPELLEAWIEKQEKTK